MRRLLGLALLALPLLDARAQTGNAPRLELRLDGIAATVNQVQLGMGVQSVGGTYLRWGGVVAAGVADAAGSDVAWRVEGVTRFLLDPFREHRHGLYGVAGLGLMDSGPGDPEPRAIVGVGVEWGRNGRWLPATEVSLGGGVRASFVLRRSRPARR